jgi:hydroxyacylglutathione hydrolase
MTIEIRIMTLGMVSTNAYLVADSETQNALVIDPVDDALLIFETAQKENWTIRKILATHAHFDHVLASHALKEMTGAEFYIHQDCQKWLDILPQQGRLFGMGQFPEAAKPDHYFTKESQTLVLDSIKLETLYTPGHAEGHISFYMREQNIVFSGDTLFQGSIGRTDLPGGNYELLMQSIFQQLVPLGDNVQVLSGHGSPTTIGQERKTNMFLRDYND